MKKVSSLGSIYGKVVLIILAVAGVLIFLDSFSWKHGGMNGLWSMIIGFLAVGALIIVTLAFFAGKIAQYFLAKSEISQQQNQSLPTQSIQAEIDLPENVVDLTASKLKRRKNLPLIIFGIIIAIGCFAFLALPTIIVYLQAYSALK